MRFAPFVLVFLLTAAAASPAPVTTWFDAATARELMDARREFDLAELKAIAAFDRAIGGETRPVAMPVQQYRDQVASPALREIRWSQEQQRRSAAATPARQAAVDAASGSPPAW